MKTIYADFNDVAEDGSIPLTSAGSVASISSLITPPAVGERVWLTDGELWALAMVSRLGQSDWCADAGWQMHPSGPAQQTQD